MWDEGCVTTEDTIWLHNLLRLNEHRRSCRGDALQAVREVLQAIPYSENDVWVHTDKQLMPRRRETWASWNFLGRWASFFSYVLSLQSVRLRIRCVDPKRPSLSFGI